MSQISVEWILSVAKYVSLMNIQKLGKIGL